MKDQAGPAFPSELVSRALAAGDIDNDGDLDLLITNNGGPTNLLLNEGGRANGNPPVRAIGRKTNRSGIGTRLTLITGGRRQVRDVQSRSSYLAQNDLRAHFGLGPGTRSERLDIRWPDGTTEVVENLPANHIITVREGEGVVNACRSGADPSHLRWTTRQPLVSAFVLMLLVVPSTRYAQRARSSPRSWCSISPRGLYGDEGPRLTMHLEAMSTALTRWDNGISDAERQLRPRLTAGTPRRRCRSIRCSHRSTSSVAASPMH